jgi:putative ATP-dependent endonuclease of the OLD family
LYQWQEDAHDSSRFHDFKNSLLAHLNAIFKPPFDSLQVIVNQHRQSRDMLLKVAQEAAKPVGITAMGSGVQECVILLANLLHPDRTRRTLFLEEPETHLHPALLRGLMSIFAKLPRTQFFISTHANAILDSVDEEDRVYRFSQNAAGECTAAACREVTDFHHVLDSLGVTGSSLLLANCVVWVEGPSDRTYIREWLAEVAAERKMPLREGVHYAFVIYGGKLVSNLSLEADDATVEEFVQVIRVCRYSAVVMDRDAPPGSGEEQLTGAKRRILKEAQSSPTHLLACVTVGREIENDLPSAVLLSAAADFIKCNAADLSECKLTGEKRFGEEIIEHLKLGGGAAETAKRKLLKEKPALAERVLKHAVGKKLNPPAYVHELFDLIVRSNAV